MRALSDVRTRYYEDRPGIVRRAVHAAGLSAAAVAGLGAIAAAALGVYALAVDVDGADGTIPAAGEPVAMTAGRALALFDAVPMVDGKATFGDTRRADLEIDTLVFDRTPWIVAEAAVTVERAERVDLALAGDAEGTAPWSVDNLLLIESYVDGALHARAYAGETETLWAPEGRIGPIGPSGFTFAAGEITVTRLVPPDRAVVLRFTALDNGIDATVSDLFLVAAD